MNKKSRVLAPLFALMTAGSAGVALAVPSKLCLVDEYGDHYKLTVDSTNGFAYGTMEVNVANAQCLAKSWTIMGSYVAHGSQALMELTASNPLGAVDNVCVATYMLKGNFPNHSWYYPDGTANVGETTYSLCSASGAERPEDRPATGRGLKRTP